MPRIDLHEMCVLDVATRALIQFKQFVQWFVFVIPDLAKYLFLFHSRMRLKFVTHELATNGSFDLIFVESQMKSEISVYDDGDGDAMKTESN